MSTLVKAVSNKRRQDKVALYGLERMVSGFSWSFGKPDEEQLRRMDDGRG